MADQKAEKIKIEIPGSKNYSTVVTGDLFYSQQAPSNNMILLFPGFAQSSHSFYALGNYLRVNFNVLIADINSDNSVLRRKNGNLYELKTIVECSEKYAREKLGATKVGAFGHSLGGVAVGLAAADKNNSLDCLCLASAPAGMQDVITSKRRLALNIFKLAMLNFYVQELAEIVNGNKKPDRHSRYKALKLSMKRTRNSWNISLNALQGELDYQRLDEVVKNITIPTLFVYGGRDETLLKIKNGVLPEKIFDMYNNLGSCEKKLFIEPLADHNLNICSTKTDQFSAEPYDSLVKGEILRHFTKYML